MPILYTIFPEERLILERFKGHVTALELEVVTKEIWADEAYDKYYDVIVDLMDAELTMKWDDIRPFIELLITSPDSSDGRAAIIVSKPMETALSFLYQSKVAMRNDVAVFSTWESVRDFLDLPASMTNQLTGIS